MTDRIQFSILLLLLVVAQVALDLLTVVLAVRAVVLVAELRPALRELQRRDKETLAVKQLSIMQTVVVVAVPVLQVETQTSRLLEPAAAESLSLLLEHR
jgi:hypothetical protein